MSDEDGDGVFACRERELRIWGCGWNLCRLGGSGNVIVHRSMRKLAGYAL
jgi:hypothetical protein